MENTKTTTKKCTTTDKPLVSILMAVYKSNEKWLIEQLKSLNRQTYPNIELLIWDDCPEHPVDEDIIKNNITNFKYTLYRGEKNLGSNGAFEELTKLGTGKYFSYCDHDDIWFENKITVLVDKLEYTNSPIVCCDVYIIDSEGNIIGNSIKSAHKRHQFREGKGLAGGIITHNFVMGCASLISSEIAKKSLPFNNYFIYDHWIGIIAAANGRVEIIREPLVYHRKHGGNQTGVLAGVIDKKDYYDNRLVDIQKGLKCVKTHLQDYDNEKKDISELVELIDARVRYFKTPNFKDLKIMTKYSHYNRHYIMFERFAPFIPNFIFKILMKLLRKGII